MVSEAVVVALITGVLSLAGVYISNRRSAGEIDAKLERQQAVMEERISALTREVREHNEFARRVPVLEEKVSVANHRIDDLERRQS
ncbi:MAG: hypothetical protein II456_02580 [Firmicutes bacterium]|nr:hypothetical protein [Bacillota bacterium]